MIPLFKPSCTEEEIREVNRVLRSGWWGMGPETEAFEDEFAKYKGARHAVAVNSATSALELAARACGITNGIVVTPALTFVSTAQAMQHAGNKVIFADVHEETLCINWGDVFDKLWPYSQRNGNLVNPQAVVPVWFGGRVSGTPPILWNNQHLTVIEDCAHAAGTVGAGCFGKVACWSFQAVKNLATGDGGMITTNDSEIYAKLKQLRWCGIDKSTWERDQGRYNWDYDIPADGEKMHMNDITAALGRVQLRRLKAMNAHRFFIGREYNDAFENLSWLRTPEVAKDCSNHLYIVRVDEKVRNRFLDHLKDNEVSGGVHYKPLTHYTSLFPGTHDVPVTERVWKTLVTLPLYPDMDNKDRNQVIDAVRSFKA